MEGIIRYNNVTFARYNTWDEKYSNTSSFDYLAMFYCLIAMLSLLTVFLVQYFELITVMMKNTFFNSLRNKQLLSQVPARRPPLPPGPSPIWPVLGCLPEMWTSNMSPPRWIHRLMQDFGTDIACIRLGNTHVIPVSSPEIAREFLKKHDAVFATRPVTMATQMISCGFLSTALVPGGEQWKKMRRVLVSEVLSQSRLRWLLNKRNQEADDLVRFLYTRSLKGDLVNVTSVMKHYPANVMKRMMFGIRHFGGGDGVGALAGPQEEEHVSTVYNLLFHVYAFCVSDYLPWLRMLDLDGHKRRVRDAMNVIHKYHDPIVNNRVEQWQDGKRTQPEDLLDVFISLKGSDGNMLLSKEEIRSQITELFMAGIDNPYNIADWALAEMLNQPKLLEKAVEELDRVVGKDRLLQESDIPHLPYVVACAREALRLHPVVPFNIPHVSTADCIIAGYFIPKGSNVLLSRLGLGRNPSVWDSPLKFDPSRHLESCKVDLAEADLRFISFTTGRRGCIGAGLGSNITVMLLGRLLQGFTWNVPDGKIDLTESEFLYKVTPLHAYAKPRLNPSVYLSLL